MASTCFAALAAVDEDLAERAVVIEAEGDDVAAREAAKVDLESLAAAALRQDAARSSPASCKNQIVRACNVAD